MARRRLVIGVAVVVLLGGIGISLVVRQRSSPEVPERLRAQHDLMEQAVADARFVEPRSIGAVATICTSGGWLFPDEEVCGYTGLATFDPTADPDVLVAHLAALGWTDNARIQRNDHEGIEYYRSIDGHDVCLSVDTRNGVLSVTTTSGSTCTDHRASELARWGGWQQFVPDAAPADLDIHSRMLTGTADDPSQVELRLWFRSASEAGPPLLELRERRLAAGMRLEDCYALADPARPSTPDRPRCRVLRTTPGGRDILVDRAETDPYGSGRVRRSWLVLLDATVIEVERVDAAPGVPALTDDELDSLIDSLRPATYAEIQDTFVRDNGTIPPAARYDEDPVCDDVVLPSGPVPLTTCED